ncbi:MAG: TIR domain-containing protein [Clostridiales bacterium]|nr:TIR domain-containing protein [Clostridiales bacterium]
MPVFRCKMCGGNLDIKEGMTVCKCGYCGSVQTVPQLDNEKKFNLFSRANRLRSACEFDKASGVYETIVSEYPEEAEAYWGLLLCKYGIEYVDDPGTGKKVPTCHRSSFESIMDDEDFEMVMECSDTVSRSVYRDEAKSIEKLRIEINEVSSKEAPYDIFICYKETDDAGNRTVDSVIAQDVYNALVEKGYKVFFSRISLEDKLGQEYEPYIFAALNSAKIMLAFGTDYEYYNSVWVKNEWSRFLGMIEKGKKKTLIPCYKGIDAYDMPKEFARLQAQDMGKVGAMQDLLRGIEKILGAKNQNTGAAPVALKEGDLTKIGLIKRAFMFISEGEWNHAQVYAEKVLDIDPADGEAYLVKAMADLRVPHLGLLNDVTAFENNVNTQKALRYGSDSLRADINGYIAAYKSAEMMRIKEEEKRKQREEKAAQEAAEKVIATFTSKGQNIAQQYADAKQQASRLNEICEKYDEAYVLKDQLLTQKASTESKLAELRSRHDSLGMFSGKEKKRLESEISKASEMMNKINDKLAYAEAMMGGYASSEDAQKALVKARADVAVLHTRVTGGLVENADRLSFGKALQVMLSNPRVIEIVSEKKLKEVCTYKGFVKIMFGHYPQAPKGGVTDIEWLVLKKEESKVLLISKDALDSKKFSENNMEATWETCSLRKWLNEKFIESAFDTEEKKMILGMSVAADKTPSYGRSSGEDTFDRIFLLNSVEANLFFGTNSARACQGTAFCHAQSGQKDQEGPCKWWLRSAGAYVSDDGSVNYGGRGVFAGINAVRPALWINIEA